MTTSREHEQSTGPGVFGGYAGFYDAIYQDKDYESECDFLERTLAKFADRRVRTILDLGCGTGGHAIPLAGRGYQVFGIDRSPEMLAQARDKAAEAGLSVEFELGDVCKLDLGRTFDAVIAMFAVVSYQCTDQGLIAMMSGVRRHLEPGGLFVFDVWHGPAVLAQRPTARTKTIELPEGETITRSATPVMDTAARTVEVHYRVTKALGERIVEESTESHKVRYLFLKEIDGLLEQVGLEPVAAGPFMELGKRPTDADWNISVVAGAV